ncbi:MAG: Ig-like domain-containing protein [bacterium]
MNLGKHFFNLLLALIISQVSFSQSNRITYNNQRLFLSGANLAWLSFAGDIGPTQANYAKFGEILLMMHDSGGNSMRWWLHTNGTISPQFNDSGYVIGPGDGTLDDLKKVLDLAWEREIGLKLCLWSFDMLRSSNNSTVLNRNRLMLNDTNYTRAYIKNCLIPLVNALKGHPAIVAWEIFNEPEGMSNEFGWSEIQHVPMASIQRFVNLCAGAIHRADPAAKVTNGCWAFLALTDVATTSISLGKIGIDLSQLGIAEREDMEKRFTDKYGITLTAEEIVQHYQRAALQANYNYYSDSRLIAAGGDVQGTLDFYSVHYYDWAGTSLSPFSRPALFWNLDKPIVVAEFHMKDTFGVPKQYLFEVLFQNEYAGALPWSWTDNAVTKVEDMLAGMKYMWDNHKNDVDVLGIGGDWPIVTLTAPAPETKFADTAKVVITAEASDKDGSVARVEFFISDTVRIGEAITPPYTMTWSNLKSGLYVITAAATDDKGHKRISKGVQIQVGALQMTRLEAEGAIRSGTPTVRSDPTASRGSYVTMQQTGTITWTIPSVPKDGAYEIVFRYRLSYNTPKNQYININGVRITELAFTGTTNTWLDKSLTVNLTAGQNIVQMELSWGWMDVDYLSVPVTFLTSVKSNNELPLYFSLEQNYPNPFNAMTNVEFRLLVRAKVKLSVYDILCREVAILAHSDLAAGTHAVRWDASNFASGVYFYRLEVQDGSPAGVIQTRKMVLAK